MTVRESATWRHKLLALHHELLYPAFLGAALFEFARKIIEDPSAIDKTWFFSGLWFVLYFSVAFLALAEATAERFGIVPFLVNLLEIAIILNAIVSISIVGPAPDHAAQGQSGGPQLHYFGIYVSWILIPITAVILNVCERRTVRTVISIGAILFALGGLAYGQDLESYKSILGSMYGLLLLYLVATFRSLNFLYLDITPDMLKRWFGDRENLA